MSGKQLQLSEPKLGVHGPVSTEQVKCSCGNASSKAVSSITLNKRGGTAGAGPIQHAIESRFLNLNSIIYSFFFISSHMHACSFIIMPVNTLSRTDIRRPFPALILPQKLSQSILNSGSKSFKSPTQFLNFLAVA